VSVASAVPITGGISFVGGYTPNNPDLSAATSVTFGPTFVFGANGAFSSLFLAPVSMYSPLAINPTALPAGPLWSVGGFALTLSSLIETDVHPDTLTLRGVGMIHSTNPSLSDTSGKWVATFNSLGNTFSWSSSSSAVPDGGLTLVLLGMAVSGLGFMRRKIAR
jgi:hypothetical protein